MPEPFLFEYIDPVQLLISLRPDEMIYLEETTCLRDYVMLCALLYLYRVVSCTGVSLYKLECAENNVGPANKIPLPQIESPSILSLVLRS